MKTTWWDRIASGITGNRSGEARLPLAAHLVEGKLLFQTPTVLLKYPLIEKTKTLPRGEIRDGAPKGLLMSNSGLSPAAPIVGRKLPKDNTCVVSTRRRVPTSWVSVRMEQPPSIELVVVSFSVQLEGQVSGLGTVHPLLIFYFFSTWCDIVM